MVVKLLTRRKTEYIKYRKTFKIAYRTVQKEKVTTSEERGGRGGGMEKWGKKTFGLKSSSLVSTNLNQVNHLLDCSSETEACFAAK